MDILEAWNKAKYQQKICRDRKCVCKIDDFKATIEFLDNKDIIADDWEIEKGKKVVVEGVKFYYSSDHGYYLVEIPGGFLKNHFGIFIKKPMKMTLEWDE